MKMLTNKFDFAISQSKKMVLPKPFLEHRFFGAMAFMITISCVILTNQSCHTGADHSSAVKIIDSLITTLTAASSSLENTLTSNSSADFPDSLQYQLQYVQDNYVGVMKNDMALLLSAYSNTIKNIAGMKEQVFDYVQKSDSLSRQLKNLRQAFQENATHDAADNEITKDYVITAIRRESENVAGLVLRSEELQKEHADLKKEISLTYVQVKNWADSLSERKK